MDRYGSATVGPIVLLLGPQLYPTMPRWNLALLGPAAPHGSQNDHVYIPTKCVFRGSRFLGEYSILGLATWSSDAYYHVTTEYTGYSDSRHCLAFDTRLQRSGSFLVYTKKHRCISTYRPGSERVWIGYFPVPRAITKKHPLTSHGYPRCFHPSKVQRCPITTNT
jgi:hypothetical protein